MQTFVSKAVSDKWAQGAKALLSSLPAFIAYQSQSYQSQHAFIVSDIDSVIKTATAVEDPKLRRVTSIALVEDVLTKRPYSKVLALTLLNPSSELRTGDTWFDLAKLARECLKSLTGEDFKQIYISHREVMRDFEGYYTEIAGPSALENELAKIVMRYGKEGKPQTAPFVPSVSQVEMKDIIEAQLEEVKIEDVKLEEELQHKLNSSQISHHSHHSHHHDAPVQDATNRSINHGGASPDNQKVAAAATGATPAGDSIKKQVRFDHSPHASAEFARESAEKQQHEHSHND